MATVLNSHTIITDLTVCFFPPTVSPPLIDESDSSRTWHRRGKDLCLSASLQSAWLYVTLANEDDLTTDDLVIIDIHVGDARPSPQSGVSWQSRSGGIWVLRDKFAGTTDKAVTEVDILFGADAIDPRPQWVLMLSSLHLNNQPEIPGARLSTFRGRAKPTPEPRRALRVGNDGKFKIVQFSDFHMGTGVGVCKDAIDANGNNLPDSEADPLTVKFVESILDAEKPDLVVLTGDQLHHDIPDTKSALFKSVAPFIKRNIPWAAVFGNHDSEGTHALSRKEQMSILENLPLSLCESGPEDVDGVGNFYLDVYDASSQVPVFTFYFLDSHGQIQSSTQGPDYDYIKPSQISWLTATCQARRKASKNLKIDILFQHIPVSELSDKHLSTFGGNRREPTEGPSVNSHLYDTLVEQRISALGCGHDHVNDFCAQLRAPGPWLCYGGCSGFRGYCSYDQARFHRRTRVWDLDVGTMNLTTWKRVQYNTDRVDELVLVENGATVSH